MSDGPGWLPVTTAAQLRAILGPPMPRAVTKDRPRLHRADRDWLAASPFCLLATVGADGGVDVSPKGDPPGFVHVLDDTTIAIPDRPGNGRADGFHNVLGNPQVGTLFLVPGRRDALRINGTGRLLRDAPFFDAMTVSGHRPRLALLVEVRQVFFHCGKAAMRSGLWDPASWDPGALPSTAALVKAVQDLPETLAELEEYYGPGYADRLYRNG